MGCHCYWPTCFWKSYVDSLQASKHNLMYSDTSGASSISLADLLCGKKGACFESLYSFTIISLRRYVTHHGYFPETQSAKHFVVCLSLLSFHDRFMCALPWKYVPSYIDSTTVNTVIGHPVIPCFHYLLSDCCLPGPMTP